MSPYDEVPAIVRPFGTEIPSPLVGAQIVTPPLCVTVKEGSRLTGLPHGAIYQAMNSGLIDSVKIMGRRLLVYSSLEKLVLSRADSRPPRDFADNPRRHGSPKPADPRLLSERAAAALHASTPKKRGRPRKTPAVAMEGASHEN